MSAPNVSCIVPVFNQAQYLPDALNSILAQTIPVSEIIVVDDGSEDGIHAVEKRFGHVARFVRQANRGPAAARNAGVALASGEWLSFLDGDDIWHREKLERQLAAFEDDPKLDYCLTYKRVFWEPEIASEETALRAEDHPIARDHPGYVMQAMLVRRNTFQRVGLLNEDIRIGEDTDWILRARDMDLKCKILNEVLVFRRLHQSNISYGASAAKGLKDRERLAFEHIARRLRDRS